MNRIVSIRTNSIRAHRVSKISIKAMAALSAAAAMVGWSSSLAKADTYSDTGGLNLSLPASWVDDTTPSNTGVLTPGASDTAQFDNSVTTLSSPTTFDLGQANTTWDGLNILNPGNAVTIDDTGAEAVDTLTLGAVGINIGSQSLTINDSVNIGTSQSWTVAAGQTLSVGGIIAGTGSTLTFTGAGTSILTGSSSYTGAVATNLGNLTLDFSNAHAPASNILNSGSTLQLGGGSFTVKAGTTSPSQTVTGLAIEPGGPINFNLVSSGGGVPTINIGSLTAAATAGGSVIIFNGLPVSTAASNVATTPSITPAVGTVTVLNPVNLPASVAPIGVGVPGGGSVGGLLISASNGTASVGAIPETVGLYDWAAVIGGTVGPYQVVGGSTIPNFYFPFGTAGTVQYATYNVVGDGANITNQFGGNSDIVGNIGTHNTDTEASLRFNTPGTAVVNGVTTLTVSVSSILSAGGILVTPNVGASDITFSGTSQDLGDTRNASGGSQLAIYQNNTLGLLNINTGLGNEHGSDGLTQIGNGSVVFGNTSAYLGPTFLDGGMTEIGNNCDLGSFTGVLTLQGGGVMASASLNMDNGGGTANFRPITLAGPGGTLAAITGATMNVDGSISGSGSLNIGIAALPGTGPSTAHTLAQVGSGTVALTGANSYVGPTIINAGALRLDASGETGTGLVTVNASGGLVGTGTVTGNVVSSGTIIPGDPGNNGNVGVFDISGNLALNNGSDTVINTGPNNAASEVQVGGTLTINPTSGVTLYDPNSTNSLNINGVYDIFSGTTADLLNPQNLSVLNPGINTGTHQPITYAFAATNGDIQVTVSGGPAVAVWIGTGTPTSWLTPTNWKNGVIPTNPGDIASFPALATSNETIALNGMHSVGIVTFNNTNGYTFNAGTGGILAFDQGALTTISTVTDSAGNQTINAPTELNSNTAVTISRPQDNFVMAGPISGLGFLSVTGPGTLSLYGSNSYSGNTTITSGTVQVGDGTVAHNSNLGSGGAIVSNYGTLIFNNTNTTTIYGALAGTGTITQAGSGTLAVAGAGATFSGPLNINGGVVQLQAENALGTPNGVTFNAPATLDLNGNDQTLNNLVDNNSPGQSIIDDVAGGATSTLTINNTSNQTFSGVIKNTSGTVNLVVSGSAILVLADSNTYTGTTTISGGALMLTANNSINPASVVTVESINGLNLANGITVANPITVTDSANEFETTSGGNATLTGVVTLTGGGDQFRSGSTGGTITYTNTVAVGAGLGIFVEGGNNLAGTSALTSTAGGLEIGRSTNPVALTVMNSASITVTQTAGLAASNIGLYVGDADSTNGENSQILFTIQDNAVVNLGQTGLDLDSDPSSGASINENFNGGTLDLANFACSETFGPTLSLNGTVINATASDNTNGTAALFFPALNSVTANIGTGGFILNNGGFNITINQNFNGSGNDGGITIGGAGTVTLTSQNSYNGPTTVNGGELKLGTTSSFSNSTLIVGAGALVDLNGTNQNVEGLGGSGTIDNIGSPGTAASVQVNFNNNPTQTFAGNIQNSQGAAGTVSLTLNNNGTLVLSGNNTYAGATNINNNELVADSSKALSAATSVTVQNSGELALGHGIGGVTIGLLSVNSGSTVDLTNSALTISYAGSADPIVTILSYLTDGYNAVGGHWTGGEIQSTSVVAGNASQKKVVYSIGYADGADHLTTVPSGEIEVLPTLAGDAKLQGNVVFGDFQVLAQYFGQSNTGWDQGDFTYSGTTNFGDYQLLAQDFGSNSSGLNAGEIASMNSFAANFGDALVPNADGVGFQVVSVPEPASIGFLGAVGLGLLGRRRRKASK
jgi:fibronectin-binding autotransporter adhesin